MSIVKPIQPITTCILYAGGEPVPLLTEADGTVNLMPWQKEGFDTLSGKDRGILIAPTGSGKSILIRALTASPLHKGLRTIIAVPQNMIATSFGNKRIRMPDGSLLDWAPGTMLTDGGNGTVEELVRFVQGEPRATHNGRTLVCTHAALVAAHKRLMSESDGLPWDGVALFIDEGHHSKAGDDDDVDTATRNQLGKVVNHFTVNSPGPICVITATWLRQDWIDIVPASADFTKYVLYADKYLASMNHLKEVHLRFIIGDAVKSLKHLYKESKTRKTVVWLPPVNSKLCPTVADKGGLLSQYRKAAGNPSSVDLVTVEGRDSRKADFIKTVREQRWEALPDTLWALNLVREGFDCPPLERGVVVGPRGSITMMLQMLGRIIRDFPGKEVVEFNQILPFEQDDPDQIRDYLKVMLVTMVVEWHIKPVILKDTSKRSQAAVEAFMGDTGKVAETLDAIVDAVIRNGDKPISNPEALIRSVLPVGTKEPRAVARYIGELFSKRSKDAFSRNVRDLDDIDFDPKMSSDMFGCLRVYAAQFGAGTLGELRERLGVRGDWVDEDTLRDNIQGLDTRGYAVIRNNLGPNFPLPNTFLRIYGKTFCEIRDGTRGNATHWVDIETLREKVQGMTQDAYNQQRKTFGPNYPGIKGFKRLYGKTFHEIQTGMPSWRKDWVDETTLRSKVQGMIQDVYDQQRKTFIGNFPNSAHFPRIYGRTYREVQNGRPNGWVDETTLHMMIKGLSLHEYNVQKADWGNTYPAATYFRSVYNKTFREIKHGTTTL